MKYVIKYLIIAVGLTGAAMSGYASGYAQGVADQMAREVRP